ncbi:hypothetical protein B0H16DRAFT_1717108 [Mycena metata]|uniref:Uncharacterized protein n=1 Tax=Mycena metata TaxID=1033252 RepID=A0AAD7JL22_9AGAR|nr:hypothetical protein B0H16DRAFT_1717108 [Mycena metata]
MHYPPPIFAQAPPDAASSFGAGGIAFPSSGAQALGLSRTMTLPTSLALPSAAPQPLENGTNAIVQPACPSSAASPSMPLPTLAPKFAPPARRSNSSAPAGSLPHPNTLLKKALKRSSAAGPFSLPIAPHPASRVDPTVDKPKNKKRGPRNKKAVSKASASSPVVQGSSNPRKRTNDAVEEESNKKQRTKFEHANPDVARGMAVFKPSIPPQANVGADNSAHWSHPPSVPGHSFIPPPPPATTPANHAPQLVHRQLAAGQMPVVHDAPQGVYGPLQPDMQTQNPEARSAPYDASQSSYQPAAFQQSMQYQQHVQMRQRSALDVSRLLLCEVPETGIPRYHGVPPEARSIVSSGGNVRLTNMVVGPMNQPFLSTPGAHMLVRLLRGDKLTWLRQSEGKNFYGNELYDMQTLEEVVLRIDFSLPQRPTLPQGQGFPDPAQYVPAYPHISQDDAPLPFMNDDTYPSPHQDRCDPDPPHVEAAQANPFASYPGVEESTYAPILNSEAYSQAEFPVTWNPLLAHNASTQTGQSHYIPASEEYNPEAHHHFTAPSDPLPQVAYNAQIPTDQAQFVATLAEYPHYQSDSESGASSTIYLSQEELDASALNSTVSPVIPEPETSHYEFMAHSAVNLHDTSAMEAPITDEPFIQTDYTTSDEELFRIYMNV